MNDLDEYIRHTMKTNNMSPKRRAKISVRAIAERVRIEEGLLPDTFLPVPMEWEHRVMASAPSVPVPDMLPAPKEALDGALLLSASIDDKPGPHGGTIELVEEPTTMNYYPEPVHDLSEALADETTLSPADDAAHDEIAVELMKESFNALYHDDVDLAEKKFEEFWNRDKE